MSKILIDDGGDGVPVDAPRYRSFKVVQAAPILSYDTFNVKVDLGDGKVGIVRIEPHLASMFEHRPPAVGDMIVIYDNTDGSQYVSVSPRAEFDAGYKLATDDAPALTQDQAKTVDP